VDGGAFVNAIPFVSPTLGGTGWQDDLTQNKKYCGPDWNSIAGTDVKREQFCSSSGGKCFPFPYDGTEQDCKDACVATTGCLGVSMKGWKKWCLLVTALSSYPCTTPHDAWTTYWRGVATQYNDIYTLDRGGYVDTGVDILAKDLHTISCWVKVQAHPSSTFTEVVAKSKSCVGFELLISGSGLASAYLMAGCGATQSWPSVSSNTPIPIGKWVHLVATHDPVVQPSVFAQFGDGWIQGATGLQNWTTSPSIQYCWNSDCSIFMKFKVNAAAVGFIEKKLPSYDGVVTVRWGNSWTTGTVKLFIGKVLIREAISGDTDITTTVPFKSEDLFRLE
jgi:hypothetical protein